MDTVIDLRILDPRFQSGLVFSFFEGLIQGKNFKLVFDHDPKEISEHFSALKLANAEVKVFQKTSELWEMLIKKSEIPMKEVENNHNQTCCGICGGKESSDVI